MESTALVMSIRDPLISSVMAGPVHTVFTSSPSSTNWLSVVVQVIVRGVPAEREPLRLAEIITDGGGTGEDIIQHAAIKLTIKLTLNDDNLTEAAIEIRDTY